MSRNVQELLASRDWEHMSQYDLEILRGMLTSLDPDYRAYMQALTEAKKKASKQKMTEERAKERTFLQQLYDHEQARTTPVVDEAFVQAFSALDWEDQCRAMSHIFYLKQAKSVGGDPTIAIYKGRLEELYKSWLLDQTETWVSIQYEPPNEKIQWADEDFTKTVSLEEAKRLILADHVEVGQESVTEDAVINAFLNGGAL